MKSLHVKPNESTSWVRLALKLGIKEQRATPRIALCGLCLTALRATFAIDAAHSQFTSS